MELSTEFHSGRAFLEINETEKNDIETFNHRTELIFSIRPMEMLSLIRGPRGLSEFRWTLSKALSVMRIKTE
jgi:hypothetical protein